MQLFTNNYMSLRNNFKNMWILQNKICLNLNRLHYMSTKSTKKNLYYIKKNQGQKNLKLSQNEFKKYAEIKKQNLDNHIKDFPKKKIQASSPNNFKNSKQQQTEKVWIKREQLGSAVNQRRNLTKKHFSYLSSDQQQIRLKTSHKQSSNKRLSQVFTAKLPSKIQSQQLSIRPLPKIQTQRPHFKLPVNTQSKQQRLKTLNRYKNSTSNKQSFYKGKYTFYKKKYRRGWKKNFNKIYFDSKKLKKLYFKYRKYLRRKRYKSYKRPNVGYIRLRKFLFERRRYLRKKYKYNRIRFKKSWLGYLIQKTQHRLWYPFKHKGRLLQLKRAFKFLGKKKKKIPITGKWWHKNKKPYWRRKRYRKFRFYEHWVKGYYRFPASRKRIFSYIPTLYKKKYDNIIKKWNKEESWLVYFRRKKTRFWFRNKIFLRFMWQYRYSTRTHKRMDKFVRSFRRSSQPLKKFIRIELRLDRFILWWGLINKIFGKHDKFARSIVEAGYIWVNFRPVYNYKYVVKKNDCVFFFNRWHSKIKILPFFFASQKYATNFGTVKYQSGYSSFNVPLRRETIPKILHKKKKNAWFFVKSRATRRYPKKEWKRFKQLFGKHAKTLKGVKKLLTLKWLQRFVLKYHYYRNAPLTLEMQYYLTQAYYYFEKSYKYRLVVVLHAYTWAVFMLTCSSSQSLKITYQKLNMLINKRYW